MSKESKPHKKEPESRVEKASREWNAFRGRFAPYARFVLSDWPIRKKSSDKSPQPPVKKQK